MVGVTRFERASRRPKRRAKPTSATPRNIFFYPDVSGFENDNLDIRMLSFPNDCRYLCRFYVQVPILIYYPSIHLGCRILSIYMG